MSVNRKITNNIFTKQDLNEYFDDLKEHGLIRDYKILEVNPSKYEVNIEVIKPFPYIEFEYKFDI